MFSEIYLKEYKKNLSIAVPVALSQLGHIAVGVADSIMVGKLGGKALASATVAFSISIPFMMFGIGISYGVSALVAKADGENKPLEIAGLLKHSFFLNILIGILLFLFLYFSSPLLWKLNQPDEVIAGAIPFFRLLAVSMIPLMVFQTFRQFAEGLGITRQAMLISISGNVLNIILNYIFINGKWGIMPLGVAGAGYATLSARIFMAFAMCIFVWRFKKFKVYRDLLSSVSYSFSKAIRLIKMSMPVGVQLTLEAGAFGFAAIMIGWLGADEIAGHHVALNMASITYMAATGIASATTVRTGNEYGRKDFTGVGHSGKSGFFLVVMFMTLCALQFIIFRASLPSIYITDKKVNDIAVSLLLICALFQISDGVQVVGLGALRGIGDVRVPTAIALLAYWCIGLPVGYVLAFSFRMGVEGVWYGLFLGLTVAAALLSVRFFIKSRRLIKVHTIS